LHEFKSVLTSKVDINIIVDNLLGREEPKVPPGGGAAEM